MVDLKTLCIEAIEIYKTCANVCNSCCGTEVEHKLDMVAPLQEAHAISKKIIEACKLYMKNCTDKACQSDCLELLEKAIKTEKITSETTESCKNLGYDCQKLTEQAQDICLEVIEACQGILQNALI